MLSVKFSALSVRFKLSTSLLGTRCNATKPTAIRAINATIKAIISFLFNILNLLNEINKLNKLILNSIYV